MLHIDRAGGSVTNDAFVNFPSRLGPGDVLVVNNTKVFPARLFGKSESGAKVEIFLIRELEESNWEALARPARRLPVGPARRRPSVAGDRPRAGRRFTVRVRL